MAEICELMPSTWYPWQPPWALTPNNEYSVEQQNMYLFVWGGRVWQENGDKAM